VSAHNPDGAQVVVAVVSWNTRELLASCLESLANDVRDGVADVWVVDNASTDGSADMVREDFPWAGLIASSENLGFGAGVNAVASRARAPWLALANADTALEPDALHALLATGAHHPEAGLIAPRLILPDGTTQHSVYPFPTIPFTLAYVSGAIAVSDSLARQWCFDRGFDRNRGQQVPWAVGAFALVRRSAWDQVGGFDESQWMYAEDLDLGWRLHMAGWTTRYEPRARVHHAESAATTQAWGDGRHARWHASTYAWLLRRRGIYVARIIALINVLGFMTRAAVVLPGALLGSTRCRLAHRDALNAARAHTVGLRSRGRLQRVR
jgi:GT2 family glycosyltransferase